MLRKCDIGAPFRAPFYTRLFDQVQSGLGRVEHGDFVIADLNARWYLDADRQHRLSLRVENLFDEEYFTSIARGFVDITGTPYQTPNLGTPRSVHAAYTFDF
jgi:vitamin B12 transporter